MWSISSAWYVRKLPGFIQRLTSMERGKSLDHVSVITFSAVVQWDNLTVRSFPQLPYSALPFRC